MTDAEREDLIQRTAARLGSVNSSREVREIAKTLKRLCDGRSPAQVARMEAAMRRNVR